MRWHGLLGLSLVANLALAGCQSARRDVALPEPDLAGLLTQAAGASPRQARAQARTAGSLLDPGPDADGGQGLRVAHIRAVINGEPILDEELLSASQGALQNAHSDRERAEVLQQKLTELIDREVVLQDAFARLSGRGAKYLDQLKKAARDAFEKEWLAKIMRASNFKTEEELKAYLRGNGMPLEVVRRHWERNFMAMEYLRHRIEPHLTQLGHLDVVGYYTRHPDDFRVADEVQWQDLFIAVARHPSREAARRFAESLAARVRKGEDFVRLTKEFDNGISKLGENAEGIGRKRGEIKPPEAEPVLFALRDGEVGPLVELETGFHVVRVVKRQRAGVLPFNAKVQKQIKNKLRNQVFQREMKRIVADLKRRAVIEVAR
jgi:parvulin-like peptidyl-prolyl isomerase